MNPSHFVRRAGLVFVLLAAVAFNPAPAAGQGLAVSLSDASLQAESARFAPDPQTPGVHARLGDQFPEPSDLEALIVIVPDPAAENRFERATPMPLPAFSAAECEVPFADIASMLIDRRAPLDRPVETQAIEVFPITRDGFDTRSARANLDEPNPLLARQLDQAYFQPQEPDDGTPSDAGTSDANKTSDSDNAGGSPPGDSSSNTTIPPAPAFVAPQLAADPSALPRQRKMFSFSTTRSSPFRAVKSAQAPVGGLPAMMKISVDGPRRVEVNEQAAITVTAENVGDHPAEDVVLVIESTREAAIVGCDPAPWRQTSSAIYFRLGRLEGHDTRAAVVQVQTRTAGPVRLRCRTITDFEARTAELNDPELLR